MSNAESANTQKLSVSSLGGASVAPGEIVLGLLTAFDTDGRPLVTYLHSGYSQRAAVSAVALTPRDAGRQVALLFVNGDLQKPMVIGLIHGGFGETLDDCALLPASEPTIGQALRVDGKKVVVTGEEEIVLQCGESSITLTTAGKIEIRGKYLVSRATGVNRILGASVNVN
jgi:hypothetical protein